MNALLGKGEDKVRGMQILKNVGKQLKDWKIRQKEEMEKEAREAGNDSEN